MLIWQSKTCKMVKEIITFGKIEIENQKFLSYRSPVSIYNVNIVVFDNSSI